MKGRAVVRPLDLPPGRRVLAVSDIHGNLPLLKGVLDRAGFCADDVLIILGDILERHTGSLETLRYVMELSRSYRVYTLMGNCDRLVVNFVERSGPEHTAFFSRWLARMGERSTLTQMAAEAGVPLTSPADYPAAQAALDRAFVPELSFLRSLPTILINDQYLLVHGGVPREDKLWYLSAHACMKNDDFLSQGHSFRRWVVVGHWPVTLYRPDIPSAAPIVERERHILSIDGGCTLKLDGQLNAVVLPPEPTGDFTWYSYDGFPSVTALEGQAPSAHPINIRWSEHGIEVLKRGEEFCRCRHTASGRELDILTEFIFSTPEGDICEDSTDYLLPVSPGDTLTVVRETGRGLLAKKDGVTGWYRGRYKG